MVKLVWQYQVEDSGFESDWSAAETYHVFLYDALKPLLHAASAILELHVIFPGHHLPFVMKNGK